MIVIVTGLPTTRFCPRTHQKKQQKQKILVILFFLADCLTNEQFSHTDKIHRINNMLPTCSLCDSIWPMQRCNEKENDTKSKLVDASLYLQTKSVI